MSKITIDRSVVEQALEALNTVEWHGGGSCWIVDGDRIDVAINTLRAALERPDHSEQPLDMVPQVEQEPVGCITGTYGGYPVVRLINPALVLPFGTALYTHPQNLRCKSTQDRLATLWGYEKKQPPRQPLTDEQIAYCIFEARLGAEGAFKRNGSSSYRIARAIERAHGIGGEA